jgi:hypothetical protein
MQHILIISLVLLMLVYVVDGQTSPCGTCDPGQHCVSNTAYFYLLDEGYNTVTVTSCASVPYGSCASQDGSTCTSGPYATSVINCPPGNYCQNGYIVTPCPVGTYAQQGSNPGSASDCQIPATGYCASQNGGTCSTGIGLSNYIRCPHGEYCPYGSLGIPCPVGTYGFGTGYGAVTDCKVPPPGMCGSLLDTSPPTCNTGVGSIRSINCPNGQYCPLNSIVGIPCPIGTYPGVQPTVSCTLAPPGFCPHTFPENGCSMNTGSTSIIPCYFGYYCPGGVGILCPAGQYCPGGNILSGLPCPPGRYCPIGSGVGIVCPITTYSLGGSALCVPFSLGSCGTVDGITCNINSDYGSVNIIPCPAGSYCPGNVGRIYCPVGQYSTGGTITCTQTPDTFCGSLFNTNPPTCNPGIGSSGIISCPAGSYCLQGVIGQYCPPGQYSTDGSTSCTPSPIGTCVSINNQNTCNRNVGSTGIIPCPFGFTCNTQGTIVGTRCPSGSYCQNGVQIPCPPGTYSIGGAGSLSQCLTPTAGSCASMGPQLIDPLTGIFSVSTCNPGSGSIISVNCPAGFYCPYGTITGIPCSVGTYSDGVLSVISSCIPVNPRYCPAILIDQQTTICNPGTGSTTIAGCPPGYYCLGNSNPIICPVGTYSQGSGASCLFPPLGNCASLGTQFPGYGIASCNTGNGSTTITSCPPGYQCIGDGSVVLCPAGTFSPGYAVQCITCNNIYPFGQYCTNLNTISPNTIANNNTNLCYGGMGSVTCNLCGPNVTVIDPTHLLCSQCSGLTCVDCFTNSDCSSSQICIGGTCVWNTTCLGGSYVDPTTSVCTLCPVNTYSLSFNASQCFPGCIDNYCPSIDGHTCNSGDGSTSIIQCPSGLECLSNVNSGGTCTSQCPSGLYSTQAKCALHVLEDHVHP